MEKIISHCPRCNAQFSRALHTGDFVHKCVGTESVRNEDVLVIGDWDDTARDGTSDSNVQKRSNQGLANTLQGTRAGIEGAKNEQRTSRGFPTSRFRTRRHHHYIDESEFKQKESSVSDIESYD